MGKELTAIFETAKPYGPSVKRVVDGRWISVGRRYNYHIKESVKFG